MLKVVKLFHSSLKSLWIIIYYFRMLRKHACQFHKAVSIPPGNATQFWMYKTNIIHYILNGHNVITTTHTHKSLTHSTMHLVLLFFYLNVYIWYPTATTTSPTKYLFQIHFYIYIFIQLFFLFYLCISILPSCKFVFSFALRF